MCIGAVQLVWDTSTELETDIPISIHRFPPIQLTIEWVSLSICGVQAPESLLFFKLRYRFIDGSCGWIKTLKVVLMTPVHAKCLGLVVVFSIPISCPLDETGVIFPFTSHVVLHVERNIEFMVFDIEVVLVRFKIVVLLGIRDVWVVAHDKVLMRMVA